MTCTLILLNDLLFILGLSLNQLLSVAELIHQSTCVLPSVLSPISHHMSRPTESNALAMLTR